MGGEYSKNIKYLYENVLVLLTMNIHQLKQTFKTHEQYYRYVLSC